MFSRPCYLAALALAVTATVVVPAGALAASKPTPKPKHTPVPTGVHQAQAVNLLTKSLNAMKSVHSFRAQGTEDGNASFNPTATEHLSVSGLCFGHIPQPWTGGYPTGFFKTLSTISGQVTNRGKATSLAAHYLLIAKRTGTRIWLRSSNTSGKWQLSKPQAGPGAPLDVQIGDASTNFMCDPLFLPHQDIRSIVRTFTIPRQSTLSDLGSDTVNGSATEHLQAVDKIGTATITEDFYIRRSNNLWLKYSSITRVNDKKPKIHHVTTRSYVFSQFNAPVSIVAPKVGSTSP